jgi:hypothetical protein
MSAALPDWLDPLPWLDLARAADPGTVERSSARGRARDSRVCHPPVSRRRESHGSPGPTRAGPDPAPFRTGHLALCPALFIELLPGALYLLRLLGRPQDRAPQVDPGGIGSRVVRLEASWNRGDPAADRRPGGRRRLPLRPGLRPPGGSALSQCRGGSLSDVRGRVSGLVGGRLHGGHALPGDLRPRALRALAPQWAEARLP